MAEREERIDPEEAASATDRPAVVVVAGFEGALGDGLRVLIERDPASVSSRRAPR